MNRALRLAAILTPLALLGILAGLRAMARDASLDPLDFDDWLDELAEPWGDL